MALTAADMQLVQADRQFIVKHAQKRAKRRNELLHKKDAVKDKDNEGVRHICATLLKIAQRYVPSGPQAYGDFSELVRCAELLKAAGVKLEVTERFAAPISAAVDGAVTNSSDYRELRNKSIAGFATIADLTEKPAAIGTPDFQRGMREGYRRASDLAVAFLTDIQGGGS